MCGQGCPWHRASQVRALTLPHRTAWSPPSPGPPFSSAKFTATWSPSEVRRPPSRRSRKARHQVCVGVTVSCSPQLPGQGTGCQPRAGDDHTGIWAAGNLLPEENEIFIKHVQGFCAGRNSVGTNPIKNESGWLGKGGAGEESCHQPPCFLAGSPLQPGHAPTHPPRAGPAHTPVGAIHDYQDSGAVLKAFLHSFFHLKGMPRVAAVLGQVHPSHNVADP